MNKSELKSFNGLSVFVMLQGKQVHAQLETELREQPFLSFPKVNVWTDKKRYDLSDEDVVGMTLDRSGRVIHSRIDLS
jgi:hypothetical protein